ncbi:MAG: ABC transporter permease [Schleiferiaceae bacterium]
MSLWLMQWKRKWAALLIVGVLAFITGVFIKAPRAMEHYIFHQWEESASQVDLIVGYKGSPIQIVASSLYRLENPTGNITAATYEFWKTHPLVATATPIALGDNVQGHPLVGTDSSYYPWFGLILKEGHLPAASGEVVLDAALADQLQVGIGSSLTSAHGSDSRGESHEHPLQVVGIVEAKRSADKSALFTVPQTYWTLHHSAEPSYTSVMLKLKSKAAMLMLPNIIGQRTDEQGAFPVFIFGQLQKQWQPTIDQATRWSWIIAAGVILLFIAYISNLYHSERNTIAFLRNHHRNTASIFVQVFGNVMVLMILGLLGSALIIQGMIGVVPIVEEWMAMLLTVALAVGLLWIKLRKS